MFFAGAAGALPWRVAVTRDEPEDGPLHRALRDAGFEPLLCPVIIEAPPRDPAPLRKAAAGLASYDWVICASVRAVDALVAAGCGPWPDGLRSAAVGRRRPAAALGAAAGASPAPTLADDAGADALWARLQNEDRWQDRRVLIPNAPGGRRALIDALRAAGARVDEVEAYRTEPASATAIASRWSALDPDAAVIASPSAVRALLAGVPAERLRSLAAVVAIGPTTAAALSAAGVAADLPARADFTAVAARLVELRSTRSRVNDHHAGR